MVETVSLRPLSYANSALKSSGRYRASNSGYARRPVKSPLSRSGEESLERRCRRLALLKAFFGITSKQGISLAQTHANNAELLVRSKALISTMMSRFGFDGSAVLAMSVGIRPIQRKPQSGLISELIVSRWEKYTGKKAELTDG